MPLSRDIAYRSRLALVMLALVPLMKQIPSINVKIVAAARLPVAWWMSSTMGIPVGDETMVVGSTRQNRMIKMKAVPLRWLAYFGTPSDVRLLRDPSYGDGIDHSSRRVSRRVRHFFSHVQNNIEPDE